MCFSRSEIKFMLAALNSALIMSFASPRNEEWPLPDARRQEHRTSHPRRFESIPSVELEAWPPLRRSHR